jgi:hypothetical protein
LIADFVAVKMHANQICFVAFIASVVLAGPVPAGNAIAGLPLGVPVYGPSTRLQTRQGNTVDCYYFSTEACCSVFDPSGKLLYTDCETGGPGKN